MRTSLAVLMIILPAFASAAECDQWTAEMVEDEGGPAMTASICDAPGEKQNRLSVQCSGKNKLMYRYFSKSPFPPESPEYKTKLTLNFGKAAKTYPVHFEEMDGAFAAYSVPLKNGLPEGFADGEKLSVTSMDKNISAASFTLNGARKAFKALVAECKKLD